MEYRSGEDLLNMEPMSSCHGRSIYSASPSLVLCRWLLCRKYRAERCKINLEAKVLDLIRERMPLLVLKQQRRVPGELDHHASGLYCEEIARMAEKADYKVNPRRASFIF